MAESHSIRLGDSGMKRETLKVRRGTRVLGRLQVYERRLTEVGGSFGLMRFRLGENVGCVNQGPRGKLKAQAEGSEAFGV